MVSFSCISPFRSGRLKPVPHLLFSELLKEFFLLSSHSSVSPSRTSPRCGKVSIQFPADHIDLCLR